MTQNDTAHDESKPDVGATLRKKRLSRGGTLENAQQQTRIPKRLLEALENNRVDAFPAPVYLRGFLKSYCDYLELDFDVLWKQMAPAQGAPAAPSAEAPAAPAPTAAAKPAPAKAPAASRPATPKAPSKQAPAQEGAKLPPSTLIPLAVLALLCAAGVVMRLVQEKRPEPAPVREAAPPEAITPIHAPGQLTLRLTALNDTWLRLKVDGGLRFEGRIPAGTSQDWKADKSFSVRAANPAELRVFFDDKEVGLDRFPVDAESFHTLAR